jgi:hypothetical protein
MSNEEMNKDLENLPENAKVTNKYIDCDTPLSQEEIDDLLTKIASGD